MRMPIIAPRDANSPFHDQATSGWFLSPKYAFFVQQPYFRLPVDYFVPTYHSLDQSQLAVTTLTGLEYTSHISMIPRHLTEQKSRSQRHPHPNKSGFINTPSKTALAYVFSHGLC